MSTRSIAINQIRTPLIEAGPEHSDEAVVFIHGNPGSSEDWADCVAATGEFARAVAMDMPGFGRADKPDDFDYRVEGYAEHLRCLLADLGIRRVHLVLHDFGGPWGLAWAMNEPSSLASITLIDTGVLPDYHWHYLARIWRAPGLGELFQFSATRSAFGLLLKHGNPRGLSKEFVDRMFRDYDAGTRRAVLRLYRATPEAFIHAFAAQLAATFAPLDIPALVIWGERDPYLPVALAERQREAFPSADVQILGDSGHWPFADNPTAVLERLLPFLRAQVGRR